MRFEFTAVYEEVPQEDGGGYVAWVQELPGANTQGDTLDEARLNLQEAVRLILELNREIAVEHMKERKVIIETLPVPAA
ncbi:MAG: type II toxin-antitoxin system HicB family antitoxin [Acidobacteriaceae bacterium]